MVGRSERRLTILGWLIVLAAAVGAVLFVLIANRTVRHTGRGASAAVHHPQAPSEATAPSASSFRACADRGTKFSGRRAFIGITDPQVESSTAGRNCALGLLAARHVGYFRGTLAWSGIEPVAGRYNFAFYDQLIAELAQHHMRFLPGLLLTPRWASSAPPGGRFAAYPPTSPHQFAAFAAVCVHRYGPGGSFWRAHPSLPYYPVSAWQVWNEPNLVGYWRPHPEPAAYVRMLHAAYVAIKRVDPHATVVAAGMPFSSAAKEKSFLTRLFAAGLAGNFDALSIHSYSPLQAPARLKLARQLMNRHGARHAALWATEIAWAGGPPDPWAANPGPQAHAIRSFFSWVARDRARLGLDKIFWYSLQDHIYGPDPNWWGYHLGLLTASGGPKPALAALSLAAARLDQ